jgi:membrane protein
MTGKARTTVVHFARMLRQSLVELLKNDPLRMAGATAFFTTFALPPILLILIQLLKLILDPQQVRSRLFKSLSNIVGDEAVQQVTEVIMAIRNLAQSWWVIIGGFIFLLFVATTLFKVIKSSINQVWKIRPVKKLNLEKTVRSRLKSVGVILVAGVLFIVGILAEGIQTFIGKYIFEISPLLSAYFNSALNYVISVLIVTLWFAIVFRYLPDGKPEWRVAFTGALVTAILFNIGKIILHWLLSYSNINTLYGTSASIVLLLLFVFYSSLILYYGAAFTKIWGIQKDCPIRPSSNAMHYKLTESEIETKKAD